MEIEKFVNLMEQASEDVKLGAFDSVINKSSKRSDLHAFILLDKLIPIKQDIISAAEHDVVYLGVDIEELAKVITEEQIVELVACGVSYDSSIDCLYMFV